MSVMPDELSPFPVDGYVRRAGADIVLTYWATEVARRLG